MNHLARVVYWVTPLLLCLALYWPGLWAWFQQDDFAWLGLRHQVHRWSDLPWALFSPMAQGTIRPWSERVFFMGLSSLFGMRAFPFRLVVFLTQFATLLLLLHVTRRLTRSRLAGFLAPVLWLVNTSLVTAMSWSAAYNQVLCAFFLLASFSLFLRYTETNDRRWYVAQWAAFLLGFGALEMNVVYPALAFSYAFWCSRRHLRSTLPLFAASLVYAGIHRAVGPKETNFYYRMYLDATLLASLRDYRDMLLGVPQFFRTRGLPIEWATAGTWALTCGVLGYVAWQTWRRRYLPLFLLSWYFVVLAPVLPLRNHVTDYYQTMPSLGIAMLGALAIAHAWQKGAVWRALASVLLLCYAVPSAIVARDGSRFYHERGERARSLVQSVAYAARLHAGKVILLENVDEELFWAAVYDGSFRVLGLSDVFLVPESEAIIRPDPHFPEMDQYFLPAAATGRSLRDDRAVVYRVEGRRLRAVTRAYERAFFSRGEPGLARHIDVGSRPYADQVGEGWFPIESGYRWMGRTATVWLPGPSTPEARLRLRGYVPEAAVRERPLRLAVSVDGIALPVQSLGLGQLDFRLELPLPASTIGRPKMTVRLELDRSYRPPQDGRDLGLAFGSLSVR